MKKRVRDITWEDYGISKNQLDELKAFCRQYEEKKSKINRGISGRTFGEMSAGRSTGSPTERMAIENVAYLKDCEMIEQAAVAASSEIYQYIIKSVSYDLPYECIEYDRDLGRIPIGKTDFYGYRRLFYYYLSRLKIGDKLDLLSMVL